MRTLFQILIISLALLTVSGFEDLSDIYRQKLYIRAGDIFRQDLMKLMSFKSTSINFSSNNENIRLPGIPREDQAKAFFEDEALRPRIFKTQNGYIIYVAKDNRELVIFKIDSENSIVKINSLASDFFAQNTKLMIGDVVTDQDSKLYVLYYNVDEYIDPKDSSKEIKCHLYGIDYISNEFLFNIDVLAPYYEEPSMKLLTKSQEEERMDPTKVVLILFGKNDRSNTSSNNNVRFKALTIHKIAEQKYEIEQELNFKLNDILFGGRTKQIILLNIMVSSYPTKNLLFYIQEFNGKGDYEKFVYRALFKYTPLAKEIAFSEARLFIEEPVEEFFIKDFRYVYVTKTQTMPFCDMKRETCRYGKLMKDWKIKYLLLEKQHTVVVMDIGFTNVVFLNDFENNTLTYYYDKLEGVINIFISHCSIINTNKLYLAEIKSKGFMMRDVTLNTILEIRDSDLIDKQPVSLRLDDEEMVNLDITRWNGEMVVDTFDGKPISIVKTKDGFFRTTLGYAGKNLQFMDEEKNHKVKYYNKANFNLSIDDTAEIKGKPFYFHQGWVFFDRLFIRSECLADKNAISLTCKEIERNVLNEQIDVQIITDASEVGDLIVLMTTNSADIKIFNKQTKKIVPNAFKERLTGGYDCSVQWNYLICKFKDIEAKMETVRVFYFVGEQLEELTEVERDLKQIMATYFSESHDEVSLSEMDINDYGFDTVHEGLLSIMFKFVFGSYFENRYFDFKFIHNLNQKDAVRSLRLLSEINMYTDNPAISKDVSMAVLDAQVLFLSESNNVFKMFCYDGLSYYVFDHLNIKEMVTKIILDSHNLVILVYQSAYDDQYYYSIYQITQNSVNQQIRSEMIPNYDKYYRLALHNIDSSTIAIIQYNMMSSQVYSSYMHFLNGPILVSNKDEQPIRINNASHKPTFIEDKLYNLNRIKFEKDTKIEIKVNQKQTQFYINEYVNFMGNVKNISVGTDPRSRDHVRIESPLVLQSEEKIDTFTSSDDYNKIYVKETDKVIVYHMTSQVNLYSVIFKSKQEKHESIKFDLPINSFCYDVEITDFSMFCFWIENGTFNLSIKSLTSTAPQETFVISRKVTSVRILEDNTNFTTYVYKDEFNKFISVVRIDKAEKTLISKIIGKKKMKVDDLRITSYFSHVNVELDRFTLIMLDSLSNQLLFYHGAYKTLYQKYILKKTISLRELDHSIVRLTCDVVELNRFTYSCFLYSPTHIYFASIKRVDKAPFSDFKWDFVVNRSFYNALYESSLDENFTTWIQKIENNFFIYEQGVKQTNGNRLAMYDLYTPNSRYAHYILELSGIDRVVGLYKDKSESANFLKVYYTKNNEIWCRTYFVDNYKLTVSDITSLEKKNITLFLNFDNDTKYEVKFYFAKQGSDAPIPQYKFSRAMIALTIGIIVVSILILLTLVGIVALLRQRKKESVRLNMMAGANMNESNISSM